MSSPNTSIPLSTLEALKEYKYASVDKSPLSYYILNPFWTWATTLFPMWMAPNLITLTGLAFVLVNIVSIELLIPDLIGPGPSWLYFSLALGLFLYQTFDNVDGKQARRTGSSSALGELFDHGIDSLNCTLGGLVQCASMGYGSTPAGALIMIISSWPMFFSSWEQYHTGVLYLGYFNGPTEGLIIAQLCMVLSGIYGPNFWHVTISENPLFGFLSVVGLLDPSTSMETLFLSLITFALFVVHIPFCVYNVYRARSAKGLSTLPLLLQWTPILIFSGSAFAWLASPYSQVLSDNHLVLFGALLTLVFGRMTTKIILSHLLHQEFPLFTIILIPLILGAAMINAPFLGLELLSRQGEVTFLRWALCVTGLMYSLWAKNVIQSFTTYLGISCLRIKITHGLPKVNQA